MHGAQIAGQRKGRKRKKTKTSDAAATAVMIRCARKQGKVVRGEARRSESELSGLCFSVSLSRLLLPIWAGRPLFPRVARHPPFPRPHGPALAPNLPRRPSISAIRVCDPLQSGYVIFCPLHKHRLRLEHKVRYVGVIWFVFSCSPTTTYTDLIYTTKLVWH
jgi:hypothetical protein